MTDNFKVTIEVTPQEVCDLLTTAFEGATSYWCWEIEYRGTFREKAGQWYADPAILNAELKIAITYDDPEKPEGTGVIKKIITISDIQKGLQVMASEFPSHFSDFQTESGDGTTADVFWQCVVLGDVVYG